MDLVDVEDFFNLFSECFEITVRLAAQRNCVPTTQIEYKVLFPCLLRKLALSQNIKSASNYTVCLLRTTLVDNKSHVQYHPVPLNMCIN